MVGNNIMEKGYPIRGVYEPGVVIFIQNYE